MLKPLTLSLMLLGNVATAGPDATTQRLMDESPSMLDWGIYRLEERLQVLDAPSVSFNFDENIIRISSWDMKDRSRDEAAAKEVCSEWFYNIRDSAGLNHDTGKLHEYYLGNSMFSDMFTHSGYQNTVGGVSDEDILTDLDAKFRLRYFVVMKGGALTCTGKLLSLSISHEIQ